MANLLNEDGALECLGGQVRHGFPTEYIPNHSNGLEIKEYNCDSDQLNSRRQWLSDFRNFSQSTMGN